MRGGIPLSARLMGVLAAAASGAGVTLASQGADVMARGAGRTGRIYGYDNIRRHLQRQKRTWGASGSIAGQPHDNAREIARRQRQAARNTENRLARFHGRDASRSLHALDDDGVSHPVGLSRRGRVMVNP